MVPANKAAGVFSSPGPCAVNRPVPDSPEETPQKLQQKRDGGQPGFRVTLNLIGGETDFASDI